MSERDEMDLTEEITDIAADERSQAVANRENFEAGIKNLWGHSELGIEAKKAAMTMLSTKTGMYAKIPIICKADSCPFAETCPLLAYDLAPLGEYCPIETAQIELRYQGYAQDFDLEFSSFTDKAIVSEIINADIMMERCKAMMAKEGVPVTDVVAGIAENGEVYTRPEVSKYWEAYERAQKKRNEAYQLMMATRKDKKDDGSDTKSLTEIIAEAVTEGSFIEVEQRPDKFKE
ncbi:hypothetical protein [Heyndrickxia sporothermodurans]|jgi:hypothetical protein|uniref:hypothetical protein n=1 Tax=Heyndrickxia sporothermodurans TaxID=46224 RepID=UPI000D376BE7|nr:hypothetical protein [Heyndrickxia sporothermodurans]PTY92907.1 hypothetical protein B5V90_02175 [Heyndrickxia sporothermodurans]